MRTERQDVEKRKAALLSALEVGSHVPTIVERLRTLEARQRAIDDELANLRPVPRLPAAVVEDRLTEWRRLLRGSTTQARAVLQRIVVGRITFTPHVASEWEMPGGYDFEARTRFDKLFAGVAAPVLADGRDLTGTEGITRADTFDADYARILERAQKRLENRDEKGWRPRTDCAGCYRAVPPVFGSGHAIRSLTSPVGENRRGLLRTVTLPVR